MTGIVDIMKVRFRDLERKLASLVFGRSERTIEYSFIMRNLPPVINNPKILEVGCTGSSLSFKLACMGFKVIAVDTRPYPFSHKNLKFLKGDIIELDLPLKYFDFAVMVSTIEHIGMGGYNDIIRSDGDILAMTKIADSVKEMGQIFITTPIAPNYEEIPFYERYYDFSRLRRLLVDTLELAVQEFYIPRRRVGRYGFNWVKVSKEEVMEGSYLKNYPHATTCLKLVKRQRKYESV